MTQKRSRAIATIMLMIAGGFFLIAWSDPQASAPWSNPIAYLLCGLYGIVMIVQLIAPLQRRK